MIFIGKLVIRLLKRQLELRFKQCWLNWLLCGHEIVAAKHHEQIHVPDDIDSLGAHQNYHTGSSEHNHIDNIKKPAKMTQGRKSVLDWQIANRRADAYILDLAYDAMKNKVPVFESNVDLGTQDGLSRLASKGIFELQRHPDRINVNFGWTSESDPYLSRYHMLDSDTLHFPFFTEYKCLGRVFRAHLNYRQAIGPWYDWAMFHWNKEEHQSRQNCSTHAVDVAHMDAGVSDGEYNYTPAKLMGFNQIPSHFKRKFLCGYGGLSWMFRVIIRHRFPCLVLALIQFTGQVH
jgi:hypothetical protein